ncbi:hypothetical protein QBC33DRAFT_594187, partial [Phialemonium atrogriseum]
PLLLPQTSCGPSPGLTSWTSTTGAPPCFLFGDPRQLPPTVMTPNEKDSLLCQGWQNFGTAILPGIGIPVCRLKTQLRMAKGMSDTVAKIIYPDVPYEYPDSCAVELAGFQAGRDLEDFVRERYPEIIPAPTGTSSQSLCTIALGFIVDLVKSKKQPQYAALANMQAPTTVDLFQGQENDVVVVVMGTASPKPGPGFTSDSQRLNVMLTRQWCGLVIVGDINTTGQLVDDEGKGKGKGKRKWKGKGKGGEERFEIEGPKRGEILDTGRGAAQDA